jgi:hypothetical protein
MILILQN